MTKQPNFLFFITDQHRADWLGCMGHPVVKTPNIDRIASEGTLFTDFHVASPVCMPNRASLLTGRMPSLHGLRYNGCVLPARANTFVDILSQGGYRTAAIGKSHLQPFLSNSPVRAKTDNAAPVPEAWKPDPEDYLQEQPDRFQAGRSRGFTQSYYGYQHVDMVTGHGDQCGGHYQQWFQRHCPNWQELSDRSNELPHNYTCPQAFRTPIPEEYYPTTWIANRAIDYLDAQATGDNPFFAFVSFPDPHHPFNPPGKYWDMYSPEQFDLELPYEAHQNPPPPMEYLTRRWKEELDPESPQSAFRADRQHILEAMALTAGMITLLDDQIGRVIEALKKNGQYENTVIVFTSDHGEYLGDFNFLLKGALPFRSITRVPMIWSDPENRTSHRNDTLASTIDISATILDRAGLPSYNGIQGKSFRQGLFEDNVCRDELLMEFNDLMPRTGFDVPARVRSLLTKNWRFTCYMDQDWGELYDLQTDPHETRNLWDDPAYAGAKAAMSLRLINHLTAQMDESPLSTRLA